MTIVILLILAGITLVYVFGNSGVFQKAQETKEEMEIAKAKEKLEITLNHAQMLKKTDEEYEKNEYLNLLMKNEIKNIKIDQDIVIVDGYGFAIDRDTTKIERYVGKIDEMPNLELQVEKIKENEKVTIQISAKEEISGIKQIEIIFKDKVIKTYSYQDEKEQINITFDEIEKNGEYTVRVIASIIEEKKIEVNEIKERLYLIKAGKDCTEVTGGWEGVPYYGRTTGTLTFDTEGKGYANFVGTDSSTIYVKATKNKIDWSKYKTINSVVEPYIDIGSYGAYGSIGAILIKPKTGFSDYSNIVVTPIKNYKAPNINQKVLLTAELPEVYDENTFADIMIHRCYAYIYDIYFEE